MPTPTLQEPSLPPMDQLIDRLINRIDQLTQTRQHQVKAVNLIEASRMLGISDYHVTRRLIDQGALRARHAGRKVLVSVQSINEWLGDKETR